MLPRELESELMDTADDAREYDAMDHAAVNAAFVADLMEAVTDLSLQRPVQCEGATHITVLDLGAGTAQIPIELCHREPQVRVVAVDTAESMLVVARENVAAARLAERIELVLADAKHLPFESGRFPAVISNSILHHIQRPALVVAEAVRLAEPGGLLFHRDLCRPRDEPELERIVATYASDATPHQQKLFADSLRAALTLGEAQQIVLCFHFAPESVRMTSNRHWTWSARVT